MNEINNHEEFNFNKRIRALTYNHLEEHQFNFSIKNLTVEKGVKNWNFNCQYPSILALFSNEEENLNNILKSLAGIDYIVEGNIFINNKDVTYNYPGWERHMVYVPSRLESWNKLFSVQHNLGKYSLKNDSFLEEISVLNKKIKTDIANLKNTGLNLDANEFKAKMSKLIQGFISETEVTRSLFIREYESQINNFHEDFARTRFNFQGNEELTPILIRKFNAEEENIIANNNLLFFQSLQDRISSLENLVGECSCGCNPPKKRKKEFHLKEILFVVAEANNFINNQIIEARKKVRTTLKSCNNHNYAFNATLNRVLAYQKFPISRSQIDQLIEEWIDLAEVQRIKFNMKQDFIAMQLLPDEMHLLLKNIRDEIKIYHQKLLENPKLEDITEYTKKLHKLERSLIDVRDLISGNIFHLFEILNLTALLEKRYANLNAVERRIVLILQKLVIVTSIVLLENPFELLEKKDQEQLGKWLKFLAKKLKIIIIFTSKSQENINLIASEICIIENDLIIQQGKINDVTNKPLSLSFLKEMTKKHLNVFESQYEDSTVMFYQNKIGNFPNVKNLPLIAIKASDITFSFKKPRFTFLYKIITISGTIKNINKFNETQSVLTFETFNNDLFEIVVNKKINYSIGAKGWIIISKNTIYIFDGADKNLIGTW